MNHFNYGKYSDNQLIKLAQDGDVKAKGRLFEKYEGFIVNESYKLSENCRTDFKDTFGNLSYLFLCAVDNFNFKGKFNGYVKYYLSLKVRDDIGKRKARMPHVPKGEPFYIRNLNEIIISDEDLEDY